MKEKKSQNGTGVLLFGQNLRVGSTQQVEPTRRFFPNKTRQFRFGIPAHRRSQHLNILNRPSHTQSGFLYIDQIVFFIFMFSAYRAGSNNFLCCPVFNQAS